MNTKLDNVTTQYRKFNENQVLTEGQLNEFLDYFEDQDRLSRTRLSGVGLACGFKSIYIDESVSTQTIEEIFNVENIDRKDYVGTLAITQGAGVTTDGDLMALQRKFLTTISGSDKKVIETAINFKANAYKYYRTYEDKINYPHFIVNKAPIALLEIITQQDYDFLKAQGMSIDDFKPVKDIEKLNEKIIILYLESYSNEESPCEDADCDNAGSEQVSNLRVLLADSQEVKNLIDNGDTKDDLYQLRNIYEDLFDDLHSIEAKRVILNPGISTASQLKSKFVDAISAITELSQGFTAIAKTFNVSLNIGNQLLKDKLDSLLYTSSSGADNYQYRYDLLKDLIDTYNEIRSFLLHLHAECCPSISSFPKHLFLGPLGATLELGERTLYRHGFYHSPITTSDDENYERVVMLANRFVRKVNGFRSYSGPVKITPSYLDVRLGDKAIPYYYNVDGVLLDKWNYEKTKTDRARYNLSYHTDNLAGEDFVQNPLNYNIDDNDFYRIEGHLGMPYKAAMQNINDLKAKYGLAFDVVALVLQKGEKPTVPVKETVSIDDLRKQLISISSDISNQKTNSQNTLFTISKLDEKLKLLNKAEFSKEGEAVTVVRQDPKKDDVVSELLSEFLDRKSGLEHLAGVERGGTFVLIYDSETNNQVIADFSLPYLCCSKKDPVFLSLPKDKLCQKDAPMALSIVPADGEVKAFVNGTQISAVTQSGGQSYFNPGMVGSAYLGQPIAFTVNDDPVDVELVVYAEPTISVAAGTIAYGEDTSDPDATVDFQVTPISNPGFTYTWNFGDGSPLLTLGSLPSNGIVQHTYTLVAGKEDVFNPTLTVTNRNGCSTTFAIAPLKLTGQMTVVCLSGMRVVVQYRHGIDQFHQCNNASFNLLGNGHIIVGSNPPPADPKGLRKGNIHLSNDGGNQDRFNYPPNTSSGLSRYNEIIITQDEAEQLASGANEGFVQFSLECALTSCHTGVAYTQLFLANDSTPIYSGYPAGNFLEINPCTGERR